MWYNIVFWSLSRSLIESFPSLQEVNPAFSPREVTVLSARKSPKITTLSSIVYVFESTTRENGFTAQKNTSEHRKFIHLFILQTRVERCVHCKSLTLTTSIPSLFIIRHLSEICVSKRNLKVRQILVLASALLRKTDAAVGG